MIRKKLQLYSLIITIISVFLVIVNYPKLSLIISSINFIISLFTTKQNKRITFFIITISVATIITNLLIINHNSKESIDIYKDKNILIGTWEYNDFGGTYIFNDDFTYTNYVFEETTNNYCKGTYEYKYGGIGKNNVIIKEDENFYYYNLTLNEEYCIINNQNTNSKNNNNLIFSISKDTKTKLLINRNTEELYILKKKS